MLLGVVTYALDCVQAVIADVKLFGMRCVIHTGPIVEPQAGPVPGLGWLAESVILSW